MPIRLTTPLTKIQAYIDRAPELIEKAVVSVLTDVGEQCIIEARDNGSYMDQTGNLRSSIGYAVVVGGRIVTTKVVEQVKEGTAGKPAAESLLSALATEHSDEDVCLIVVAGMNYAVYVEGRGLNVLTSAELLAGRAVPSMLEQLGFTIKQK